MRGIVTFSAFRDWLKTFYPQRFALIRHVESGSHGICLGLGESLSDTWKSGSVIVHWTNGEHSVPYDEDLIEILNSDIVGHHTTEGGEEIDN